VEAVMGEQKALKTGFGGRREEALEEEV